MRWYKLAAAQRVTEAVRNLEICHERGRGVMLDDESAHSYYELATKKDDGLTEWSHGRVHQAGKWTSKARRLNNQSARQGTEDAKNNLWVESVATLLSSDLSFTSTELRGHANFVQSVAVSSDGRMIASGSYDETIRLWNSETGNSIGAPLDTLSRMVTSLAMSSDGRIVVSGSYSGSICRFNCKTGKLIGDRLWGHTGEVTSVAISNDSLNKFNVINSFPSYTVLNPPDALIR